MKKNIGLYIHVPFCKSFCPYCDFYKVRVSEEAIKKYTEAVVKTTASFSHGYNRSVDTVYFGGGTPSSIPGELIARMLSCARENFEFTDEAEITVECNPGSDLERVLPILYEVGVNRLSFGMQSADEAERKKLGRISGPERVSESLSLARKIGFENISLDLMIGVPCQTEKSLAKSLEFCMSEKVKHISAYMLKIEDGTVFSRRREALELPDEDAVCGLYDMLCDTLESNGIKQYEISNFAVPGYESKHNIKYWNCEEYLGIGPAAHSYMNGKRFYYERDIDAFINGTPPRFDCEGGSYEEWLMLKLRLREGVKRLELLRPETIEKARNEILKPYVILDDEGLRLTRRGFLVSNTVISELI